MGNLPRMKVTVQKTYKICTGCKEQLPISEFNIHNTTNSRDSRSGYPRNNRAHREPKCKVCDKLCSSVKHAKRLGYTPCTTPVAVLRKSYTEYCQCCNKFVGPSIHLDHNHSTGCFRAWLCSGCNTNFGAYDNKECFYFYLMRQQRLTMVVNANQPPNLNVIVFGVRNIITYKNHRGEIGLRSVIPLHLRYGTTEYHPQPQWLLEVIDLDRNSYRTFVINDIIPNEIVT